MKIKHMNRHPIFGVYQYDVNVKRWINLEPFKGDPAKALATLEEDPFDPEAACQLGLGGNTDEQQQAISDFLTELVTAQQEKAPTKKPRAKRHK